MGNEKKQIVVCAYRDWATDIYDAVKKIFESKASFQLFTSQEAFEKALPALQPSLIFFVGWSWIIAPEIVNKYTCICLHPSPLPKYRGGSPIQHQIIRGEKESAVTLFIMDEAVDAGPVVWQEPFSLAGDLHGIFERITGGGIKGISSVINNYLKHGTIPSKPQDKAAVTSYKRRTPDQSEIKLEDFKNNTAEELYNKIRALQDPYPNAFIRCKGNTKLYIQRASAEKQE